MTDSFDGSGDYSSYNDDEKEFGKQRAAGGGAAASTGAHNGENAAASNVSEGISAEGNGHLNEKATEYVRDCYTEKNRMDRKFPIAEKLLNCEIEKVQTTGRIPTREQKYADIYREKPLRVSQKVLVPIREHPKFNFVGKLLGPKGNSLRRLQEETLCKMTVLGRNSMRDRLKEEELRSSNDPKYAHLNSDLHVEISTIAPPAEAYARIAYAMAELRKYLIPDNNDVIRQEQLRELMDNTSLSDRDGGKHNFKKKPTHAGNTGGSANAAGSINANTHDGNAKNTSQQYHGYRAQQQTSYGKNAGVPKQKVLSILEKARTAMDETRAYEDNNKYDGAPNDSYAYGHSHPPQNMQTTGGGVSAGGLRGPQYETQEYDTDFRRGYYQQPSYGGAGPAVAQSNQTSGLNTNHTRGHVNR